MLCKIRALHSDFCYPIQAPDSLATAWHCSTGGAPMRLNKFSPSIAGLILCIAATSACNQAKETATASADTGKIPITTKSAEAKKEFLQGRDFSEKLQAQDSWEHFT